MRVFSWLLATVNKTITKTRSVFGLLGLVLLAPLPVFGSDPDVYVPPALQEWEEWVLANHPDRNCPHNSNRNSRTTCVWISNLAVNVDRNEGQKGATILLEVTAFAGSSITLPYTKDIRAFDVSINDKPAIVIGKSNPPKILLEEGEYTITARLSWNKEPSSLTVPTAATITLMIDGEQVPQPRYVPPQLWFSPEVEESESDVVTVKVFRQLQDWIPQELETRIQLSVSGSDRKISLGKVLPDGFELMHVEASIPAQVDQSGNLVVQVGRGNHTLGVHARATRETMDYTITSTAEHWPSQEIWGIDHRSNLRTLIVVGVPSIDPSLASSPFTDIPSFIIDADSVMQLVEQERVDVTVSEGRFSVKRSLWLGFDGETFVAKDALSADLDQEQRLTTHYTAGEVVDQNGPRWVTYFDEDGIAKPGITVTKGENQLTATSLIEHSRTVSATGWDVNVSQLEATLLLPPGWRLLWTQGVDETVNSWLSKWDLWDIFLVLLLLTLTARSKHWWWVMLIGVTAIVTYHDSMNLTVGWLILVAISLLLEQIKNSKQASQLVVKLIYWAIFTMVAIVSVYFSITHVRQAIYPQLESLEGPAAGLSAFIARSNFDLSSPLSESESEIQELTVSGNFVRQTLKPKSAYQENMLRQTGPGTPTWEWNEADLIWYGPVKRDQTMSLTLMPPWLSRLVDALAGLLVLFVAVTFIRSEQFERLPAVKRILPL